MATIRPNGMLSRPSKAWILPWLAMALPVSACGGTTPQPQDPSSGEGGQSSGAATQQLDRMVVAGYSTSELVTDFESARSYLLVDKFEQAAKAFDRLMKLASDPELVALATFDSGLAYEGLGQRERAIERFETLAEQHPKQGVTKNALVRLTRLYGYLERWLALEKAADQLLARGADLPVMNLIEGHGAKGLALVEQGKLKAGRVAISKAQALIDQHGFGRAGAPPVQLAQVAFADGELRRIDSERIKLTPVPPNFIEVLEARCQGLLDAQHAYTEAMRSRDSHWSAMSGYRVGQLYHQLHREAMQIPPPKGVSLEQQQLFEAAMRLRYRILLEKGLKMMVGTVKIGKRTGEDSFWITRAREAQRTLEQALVDEKAALSRTPYTEEEIRAALEKLKGKKAATP